MSLILTSDDAMATILSIAETPSKNEKVSMIKAMNSSNLFLNVLSYALDPSITYGVAERSPLYRTPHVGREVFDGGTWGLLDDLRTRRLTGNNARNAIDGEAARLSPASKELMWRIITKDLKAGFGDSTVNKAIKGLIPDFPYMRCSLPKDADLTKFNWEQGVYSQEKADGMFFNIDRDADGAVTMSSRQGTVFPLENLQDIVEIIESNFPRMTRLNGEVEVERNGKILPREIGNGIMNHIQDGGCFGPGERPILKLWDFMPLEYATPKGSYEMWYMTRFETLAAHIAQLEKGSCVRVIDTRVVHSIEDAYTHYSELLSKGKEGTVVKDPYGHWRDTTSKHQVKLKLDFTVDLRIVGFEPGKGKNESTFGSVIVETCDGNLRCGVSGFKDKPGIGYLTRAQIWEKKDELMNTIMAVTANGIMMPSGSKATHSLFLPRFTEFRRDKITADSLASVYAQFEAAKASVGKKS